MYGLLPAAAVSLATAGPAAEAADMYWCTELE